MWEIIKKTDRFSHDEEVIDSADSWAEAEALAHDYQVNFYQNSAFVTFRKAGDKSTGDASVATAQDYELHYFDMTIDNFEGKFIVAKLRRVSSPPVQVGSVSDSMGSALGRLVDILRLGKESRNFADLKRAEDGEPTWMVNADTEWSQYETVACRSLGMERMKPLPSGVPSSRGFLRFDAPMFKSGQNRHSSDLQVAVHKAQMNELPYLVARVGEIMGSPAPVYMTWGQGHESALARLQDVFKIGEEGQVFQDFVEAGRRLGKKEADIMREWGEMEQAAYVVTPPPT